MKNHTGFVSFFASFKWLAIVSGILDNSSERSRKTFPIESVDSKIVFQEWIKVLKKKLSFKIINKKKV